MSQLPPGRAHTCFALYMLVLLTILYVVGLGPPNTCLYIVRYIISLVNCWCFMTSIACH